MGRLGSIRAALSEVTERLPGVSAPTHIRGRGVEGGQGAVVRVGARLLSPGRLAAADPDDRNQVVAVEHQGDIGPQPGRDAGLLDRAS